MELYPRASVLALALTATLLAGCKKQDAQPPAGTADSPTAAAEEQTSNDPPAAESTSPAATPAKAFDIGHIPVSDEPLRAWPYLVLPAGYILDNQDELPKHTKDLARVPIWTGSELLWIEGKVFTDRILADEDKTFSKFELRKGLQQSIQALGGIRINESHLSEEAEKSAEKALNEFKSEFSAINDAYRTFSDENADTYLIRRADKAIWIVNHIDAINSKAGIMVVEGPLPEPAK